MIVEEKQRLNEDVTNLINVNEEEQHREGIMSLTSKSQFLFVSEKQRKWSHVTLLSNVARIEAPGITMKLKWCS